MINFRVSGDGHDTHEFTAGPRDVLAWEAAFPNASMMVFLSQYRITELYQIAYVTLKRLGSPVVQNAAGITMSLTEFMSTKDVSPGHKIKTNDDDEGESDPTQPGA